MQTIYKKDIIENIFVFSVLLDNAVLEKIIYLIEQYILKIYSIINYE